jgi:hypothetical protein
LCCLFFCLLVIVLSVLLSFGHCVVCSSSICGFGLPLWYLQAFLIMFMQTSIENRFLYLYFSCLWHQHFNKIVH